MHIWSKLVFITYKKNLTVLVKILKTPLLTIVTKNSISDIAAVLDTSLEQVPLAALLWTEPTILYSNRSSNSYRCIFSNFFLIRSSHQRYSMKKGVLRNFTKFTGKHLFQSLFFNKAADLRPEACNFIKN